MPLRTVDTALSCIAVDFHNALPISLLGQSSVIVLLTLLIGAHVSASGRRVGSSHSRRTNSLSVRQSNLSFCVWSVG